MKMKRIAIKFFNSFAHTTYGGMYTALLKWKAYEPPYDWRKLRALNAISQSMLNVKGIQTGWAFKILKEEFHYKPIDVKRRAMNTLVYNTMSAEKRFFM
jgi:hypothetical protein